MPQVKIYNMNGEVVGERELNAKVYGVVLKPALVQQAVVSQQANSRQVLAHTKDRSEVRGGGKKPWRQKGTGRARHGSIRSPIWRGGGVTFGPTSARNFSKQLNKKMKRLAILMCLSAKVAADRLVLVDKLELTAAKTKTLNQVLNKLPSKTRKTLLALNTKDEPVLRAGRNLPFLTTLPADSLNVMDLLKHEYLILPLTALDAIDKQS